MTIYFIGIAGAGLGPLAMLALDAGHKVAGSDPTTSAVTRELEKHKAATIISDQSGGGIAHFHQQHPIEWVVASSGIPPDNPELKFAKEQGLKLTKRHELINHLLKENDTQMLAVAGTHGKTTTTAMLVWTALQLDLPISYSVGTTLSFAPPAKLNPDSQWFIYEADEYDRNFLNFHPSLSVIPALDYDHPDTYPTREDYLLAFRDFVGQSGSTITWQKLGEYLNLDPSGKISLVDESAITKSPLSLPGHNKYNAHLALLALKKITPDLNENAITDALNAYPGSSRRMEKIVSGLYSDYGHTPIEVASTLQMLREQQPESRIVAIYQPHQNIRQHQNRTHYTSTFASADRLVWLPTYLSREDPDLEVLKPHELLAAVATPIEKQEAELDQDLKKLVQDELSNGSTVVAFGAGTIDDWLRQEFQKQA